MQKSCILAICCCFNFAATAQKKGSIKGTVTDTASQPITSATVTLLQKKDSSLVSFTMTNNKGYFELYGVTAGEYLLLATHVKYRHSNKPVTISATRPSVTLDTIVLQDSKQMLNEVVITGTVPPVTLVDDTVQYNAASFKTVPNASVEQLLKKLPGIQVDKDGTIKAQGQKVNRILVDGKPFFGNDPKTATKNLPADAIDKIQVYDKMSDAAQLVGFEDGNSEKTINLKFKQDKKKGHFGKASAGAGTRDRYEERFNVHSFKGARQLSAIGMANNSNAEGFSFTDMMNSSGELNRMIRSNSGNTSFTLNPDDPMSSSNESGIKTIGGGGVNYNNIIGRNTELSSSYFYNHYNPHQENDLQRLYYLPDSSYFYNQHLVSNNSSNTHRLNASADIRIDSFHSIKITPSLGYQGNRNNSKSNYQTLSENLTPANEGFSNNYSTGHGINFSNEVLFRKKFHTKGRTFSLNLQTSFNNSESNGSLFSVNRFSNRIDSINQQHTISGKLNGYNARAVYTEPLFKRSLLELSVGHSNTRSSADKVTYDYNAQNGHFDRLSKDLSNNFINTYGFTNTGLRFRTQQNKFSLAIGLGGQLTALSGNSITPNKDSLITKTFYNLLPSLRFKYNFTQYRHLNINYTTINTQPDLAQLQPVPDISDPLNIKEGNPDLKQAFTHAVQLNFISVNPFSSKNLFIFLNLQETQNKIVNADVVDSIGIRRSKPVNVNGVYNLTGNVEMGLPLKFIKGNVYFSSSMGYSKTRQFINTAPNTIQTITMGPALRFDLIPSDKLDFTLGTRVNYYKSGYSLQAAYNSSYFSQQYEAEFNWQLPASFYLYSSFTYTVNTWRGNGFNERVPLWNAAVSRQFLHFNRGELKLSVYDMLDRNVGISRSSNQNYMENNRITNLQRFFMLRFTYSLSKRGLSDQ